MSKYACFIAVRENKIFAKISEFLVIAVAYEI